MRIKIRNPPQVAKRWAINANLLETATPFTWRRILKVVSIPANPEVRVRITSGVAHTKEAKRDILMTLRAGGDVSRQTLLENLDIDPEEEQERIAEEQAPQGPQGDMEGIDPNAPLPEGMQLQV